MHSLRTPEIINHVYSVFREEDFWLPRTSDPTIIPQKRFEKYVDPEGNIVVCAWIEKIWQGEENKIYVVFDGSDTVMITQNPYKSDSPRIPLNQARRVLVQTYGVSFEKTWREPIHKIYRF